MICDNITISYKNLFPLNISDDDAAHAFDKLIDKLILENLIIQLHCPIVLVLTR